MTRVGGQLRGAHLTRPRLGRRFQALWLGQAISQLGDYVAYLTIPLFVQLIADSTTDFGIAYALETVPTLLFGFLGGVLLDRVRLRPLMIAADLARAAAFFLLAATALGPDPSIGMIFLMSFVVGSFSTAFTNALYALLPSLVPVERLAVANGRIASSQQAATALGPLIAGVLADRAGVAPGLAINGATFLVSALSLLAIGPIPGKRVGIRRRALSEAKEGLVFLWQEARLRWSTIAAAVANFVVGFVESTLVVLATVVLGTTGKDQIGLLLAMMGIGGVAGAAVAPLVVERLGLGRSIVAGMLIKGLGLLVAVNSSYGPMALLAFFVWFVGLSILNVPLHTLRQTYTPPELLGRVITAARAIGWGTLPLGSLLGTWLADRTGYEPLARLSPILIVSMAAVLVLTPIWSDAFRAPHQPQR